MFTGGLQKTESCLPAHTKSRDEFPEQNRRDQAPGCRAWASKHPMGENVRVLNPPDVPGLEGLLAHEFPSRFLLFFCFLFFLVFFFLGGGPTRCSMKFHAEARVGARGFPPHRNPKGTLLRKPTSISQHFDTMVETISFVGTYSS